MNIVVIFFFYFTLKLITSRELSFVWISSWSINYFWSKNKCRGLKLCYIAIWSSVNFGKVSLIKCVCVCVCVCVFNWMFIVLLQARRRLLCPREFSSCILLMRPTAVYLLLSNIHQQYNNNNNNNNNLDTISRTGWHGKLLNVQLKLDTINVALIFLYFWNWKKFPESSKVSLHLTKYLFLNLKSKLKIWEI